jgi:photosystem II stability/assembly factor-like uncharacterized protein
MRILTKVIFVSSYLVVQLTSQLFAQTYDWYVIDPVSISGTPDFADVFFIDDNLGWITSPIIYNEIYKTSDGASSFSTQTTPLGATTAIHMLDADNGYSGGEGGWVYKTDDGGLNWDFIGSMGTLTDISFPFGTTPANPIGYACGGSGQVWEITSGLTNLNSPSSSTFRGISAPSVNNVWVCGGGRIYYYNGTNFASQTTPAGTFNDIHFINNLEGWVVGDGGVIGHTTNGGTSWVEQTNPDTQALSLFSVFFLNINKGWAAGNGGIILQTIDGGATWTIEGGGLTIEALSGVHFTSSTNGYVVGNGKTLIKFGELTSVENEEELPTEFSLSQNYPNPFNNTSIIRYSIPQSSNVVIKVFDVLGNEIETLVNKEKPAGKYEVEFNGTGLTSGIYFYKLRTGSFIQTRKMILIK